MDRIRLSLLVLILTLITCKQTLAVSLVDLSPDDKVPQQNIEINTDMADGSFVDLSYVISSTGATSGIRYRTSAITVTIGGYKATIDISHLVGHAPSGQSLYSLIRVTKEDIISGIGLAHEAEINTSLETPEKNIIIGANIQIYNAGTGAVLATITNREDVAQIAGPIGFGPKDIADMETRFQQDSTTFQEVDTIIEEPIAKPNKGLRPSILVD